MIFCNKLASVLPTLPAAAKVASSRITWQVPQVPSPPQPSIENGDRRPLGRVGRKEEKKRTGNGNIVILASLKDGDLILELDVSDVGLTAGGDSLEVDGG